MLKARHDVLGKRDSELIPVEVFCLWASALVVSHDSLHLPVSLSSNLECSDLSCNFSSLTDGRRSVDFPFGQVSTFFFFLAQSNDFEIIYKLDQKLEVTTFSVPNFCI